LRRSGKRGIATEFRLIGCALARSAPTAHDRFIARMLAWTHALVNTQGFHAARRWPMSRTVMHAAG